MAHDTNSMLLKGVAMALLAMGAMPACAFAQQQDPSSLPSSPTPKPAQQPPPQAQQGDSSSSDSAPASKQSPDAQPPDSSQSPPPAPDSSQDKPPQKPASHRDDDGPQWSSSKKADSDSKDGEDDATDAKSKGKKSAKNAAADDDDESADASAKPKTAKPGVLAPESDPSWDPFHAAQDMDVGKFYMDKGDWDAAITRFEDAIRLRANFAKPREMMAEAYEKKGDKQEAVRYYKEYLQVLPNAPDAKKIQKKIEQLSAK
jgi:tetratricopeptide (TPR) repeat protein